MKFKTELLDYQKEAVKKLEKITVGALYMEMGTGKTRTALELIKQRFDKNKVDKVLWLCPCSVKENLRIDLEKHIDEGVDKIEIHGIESLSSSVALNSYLLNLVENNRIYLIVDESNLVKNPEAIRTRNIIRLSQKCKYKLILNGTPITRNIADLFSQWYILDWRILGYRSYWSFQSNHLVLEEHTNRVIKTLNVDYLTAKIEPYTFQVKKEDCIKLPAKVYRDYGFDLTKNQFEEYNEAAEKLLFEVDEMQPETIYRLFSGLQAVIAGYSIAGYNETLLRYQMFRNPEDNPRIQALLEVIQKDRKTIIYCKYTDEINWISSILNEKFGRDSAVPFFGEMNLKKRNKSLKKFADESTFLVANKSCAGYGLNLQFCDYVIYYNNDFDLGTRLQSEDRVHRLGQTNQVEYVDIYANDTLDVFILKCLSGKENLLDVFKRDLSRNCKNRKEVIEKYIYYSRKGKKKVGNIKEEKIEINEDLRS